MSTFSVEPNPRVTYAVHHEDEHLLVVEKASGLITQPGVGAETTSLLNGIFATWGKTLQNLGASRDFGLVHRLDRATSGVLVVALTKDAYDGLRAQFADRKVTKMYWALTRKAPRDAEGVIRLPIEESVRKATKYTNVSRAKISSEGRPALTAYRTLAASDHAALIEARPVTGRLHQIRIHMDAIGATVLGDDLYGPHSARTRSPRLALHAHRLAFDHPITQERIDVRTAWPRDLRPLLKSLRIPRPDLARTENTAPSDEE